MRHDRVDTDNESALSDQTVRDELRETTAGSAHHGFSRLTGERLSAEHHDEPLPSTPPTKTNPNAPVAWRELPRKDQLFIITVARMSEPLVQSSLQVGPELLNQLPPSHTPPKPPLPISTPRLSHSHSLNTTQAYMYYQLKSFSPSLPPSAIAAQAGIIYASFTAAQFLTAMLWGRVADSPRFGRKCVLLVGLCGTALSCLGFGFSRSFSQALAFRTMGGMTNGNVGVMRTMFVTHLKPSRQTVTEMFLGSAKSSAKNASSQEPSSSSP